MIINFQLPAWIQRHLICNIWPLLTDINNKMTCVKFSPDIVDGSPAGKLTLSHDDATRLCAPHLQAEQKK